MFDLFLIACVNDQICEYVQTPAIYESETSCRQQAALIAGMVQGRYDAAGRLTYEFHCAVRQASDQAPPLPEPNARG
jgi:hypothetical protein